MPLSTGHYLENMSKLTNQFNPYNYKEADKQRLYLKDIDCPQVWNDKLKEQIPPSVFYLNDSTGDPAGPGSVYEANNKKGRGIARAGDLMSCLPPAMRAENMMCYIGHEGTYTPAHREMCASLGQNLMVEASGNLDPDGKPTKPGSSIWFMTETKDRFLVSEYWLSTLGHDIEVENHFAQINAWKAAPFTTYVVDQKVGDFILIPPLAPHQVWNRGTRTMKAAWNRTTVETLELALSEALPRAKMVCRDEQYKNKAMVYFSLDKYSQLLQQVESQKQSTQDQTTQLNLSYGPKIRQLQKDFRRLYTLYTQILLSEMLAPVTPGEKKGQYIPYDSFITCSYCRCNIFNRFLTCTSCIVPLHDGEEDTYDMCMECFAMGRSCRCLSNYRWVEQFPWQDLVQKHELWGQQIIGFEGKTSNPPQSLQVERSTMKKKPLAQVCQEQIKLRPWVDITKESGPPDPGAEQIKATLGKDNDNAATRKRKRRESRRKEHWPPCHVSHYPEPLWKLAHCKCDRYYSYGTLFRGFDMMPLTAMEDPDWQCPYCLKICSCAVCKGKQDFNPFEPTGTILGWDTKKLADPRSVESLVAFRVSNMKWIQKLGEDDPFESRRIQRRKDEAEKDKSKDTTLDDDNYVDEDDFTPVKPRFAPGVKYVVGEIPIDPMLSMGPNLMDPRLVENSNTLGSANKSNGHQSAPSLDRPSAIPVVNMISHSPQTPNFTAVNGQENQYPDPTLPRMWDGMATSPTGNGSYQQYPQDGYPLPPTNDANAEYHERQISKSLAEARRNGRYICAKAAIFGVQKVLKFHVNPARLAAIAALDSMNGNPSVEMAFDEGDPTEESEDTALVRSDVPNAPNYSMFKDAQVQKPLKKGGRPPRGSTDRGPQWKGYTEVSDDNTSGGENEGAASSHQPKKPRPLPGYLARRDSHEFSTELSTEPRPRKQPPTQTPKPQSRQEPKPRKQYIARRSKPIVRKPTVEVEAISEDEPPREPASEPKKRGRKPKAATNDRRHTLPANGHSLPSRLAETGANGSTNRASRDNSPATDEYASDPIANGQEAISPRKKSPSLFTSTTRSTPSIVISLPVEVPPKTTSSRKSAVQTLVDENQKAKMKAMQWGSEGASDSDSASSEASDQSYRKKKPVPPKPIFSKPGVGKRVKIASAKKV